MVWEETKKEIKTKVASLDLFIYIKFSFLIYWQVEICDLEKYCFFFPSKNIYLLSPALLQETGLIIDT